MFTQTDTLQTLRETITRATPSVRNAGIIQPAFEFSLTDQANISRLAASVRPNPLATLRSSLRPGDAASSAIRPAA